jgi:phage repressor protein C with HTH and peptisase S24 domain
MNSIVTQRFVECHHVLKDMGKIKSSRQFALSLEYQPQSLNDILKGKRDVTIELLRKASEQYGINPDYVLLGKGEKLQSDADNMVIVTDKDNNERIVYVPVAAQAGYGNNLTEQTFFEELPTFSLPDYRYQQGTHRCFDVTGDSMEPTLFSGDKVVCSFIDPLDWNHAIKDHFVYVIITRGDVVVKRVVNKLKESQCLELFSDNDYYDPYILEGGDIVELWYVETKISPFLPSPSNLRNSIHSEMDSLKTDLRKQSDLISNLNSTIEMLIKQNRSRI